MTDDEESPSNQVLRQHSRSLFNLTSSVMTGGASVAVPPTGQPSEDTPLRQSSRRRLVRSQYQARLLEEVHSLVRGWLIVFGILMFILVIALVYFFIDAFLAAVNFFNGPCDEPLKYYLIVVVLWSQVPAKLRAWLQETFNLDSPYQQLGIFMLTALPGCCIIGWGISMLVASKTCAKTNPGLFYPTEYFIIAQVVAVALFVVFVTVSLVGLGRFVALLARLNDSPGPGCAKAVRDLPKVPAESIELMDDVDGDTIDCPICMNPLSGDQVIVKTHCSPLPHYFHEECLATWCESHMDCPLCRQEVGEEDHIGDTPRGSDAC